MTYKTPKRTVITESILNFLSIPITKIIIKTNLTPNFITFFGGLLALFGIIIFPFHKTISCLLLLLYLLFDLVDGDIARAKNLYSKLGWWGDKMIDKSVESFLIFSCFYTYKGNLFLEYSLFIILCFVYITQFSMEAINNLKINSRKGSSENVINFEKNNFQEKNKVNFLNKSRKNFIILLDNLTLGHSTLILMLSFGNLFFGGKIIIPLVAIQSLYTFLYLLICHYRITTK